LEIGWGLCKALSGWEISCHFCTWFILHEEGDELFGKKIIRTHLLGSVFYLLSLIYVHAYRDWLVTYSWVLVKKYSVQNKTTVCIIWYVVWRKLELQDNGNFLYQCYLYRSGERNLASLDLEFSSLLTFIVWYWCNNLLTMLSLISVVRPSFSKVTILLLLPFSLSFLFKRFVCVTSGLVVIWEKRAKVQLCGGG